MYKNWRNSMLFLLLLCTANVHALEGINLCTSSKNSLAHNLPGTWKLNPMFTVRLKPDFVLEESSIKYHTFTFVDDYSSKVRQFFGDLKRNNKCAYLTGRLNFPLANDEEQEYFALITENGLPAIAVTDSPGCSKAKKIMLVTGDHKINDILYIEFGRGMLAYTRVRYGG